MTQLKIRVIRPQQVSRNYKAVYGITIPEDIAIFFKDVSFTVNKIEQGILLSSGTNFKDRTEIDLENYKV